MTMQYEIRNIKRLISPIRIGDQTPKIVVNLGITNEYQTISCEIEKARVAVKHGASIIADVTTIGEIQSVHKALMETIDRPINTVPLYEIYQQARKTKSWDSRLNKNQVLDIIEAQADSGVDCMTLHSSYKIENFEKIKNSPRRIRIQGRGGGLIHEYFIRSGNENPLYLYFDDILRILKKYHVTLSLGNCLRNGTIDDPIDDFIQLETLTWAKLSKRAIENGINVMTEGLSHIRFGMINPYVRWVKTVCPNVPIRLLGPLGTEKGLGYDHITAAICATEAIRAGTDLITCVTRAEHIGLPSKEEIREAVVSIRIAIELATQSWEPGEVTSNFQCGLGFENLKSDNMFDLEKAVELKLEKNNGNLSACSMCAELCRIRLNPRALVEE